MSNTNNDQNPNKDTSKLSKEYLPDYVKARSKHHSPPHLGTFDVGMSVPQWRPDHVPDTRIDKFTFFMVLVILFSISIPLILFPEQGKAWVGIARSFVVDNFGFAYLTFGALSIMFVIYIVISDIGKIKLGRPEETPEFSDASWASMLFCGGIG
ncbi:BCCT family transporter, partial [Psychrobacter sp. AOP7-A1-24]